MTVELRTSALVGRGSQSWDEAFQRGYDITITLTPTATKYY